MIIQFDTKANEVLITEGESAVTVAVSEFHAAQKAVSKEDWHKSELQQMTDYRAGEALLEASATEPSAQLPRPDNVVPLRVSGLAN